MATKTANVTARIQPDIKESSANGIPFELKVSREIETRDTMADTRFDTLMQKGLEQARTDDSRPAKDVFADLRKRV